MTDKVIEFPKNKVVREIPEEVHKARQAKADQKFADSVVDEISGLIITELDNYYIEVSDKQFAKDFVVVVDTLKSAIYRQLGIYHHFQNFVDSNVTMLEGVTPDTSKEELQSKIDEVIKELMETKNNLDNDE